MKAAPALRRDGRAVEALLILLKHLTAHARWIFAALLVVFAATGIRSIQPHEQALLSRFGRLQPRVHGPGLLIGLPEPFDKVLRFDTGRDVSIAMESWAPDAVKIGDPDKQLSFTDAEMDRKMRESTTGGTVFAEFPEVKGKTLDPVTRGYTLTSDCNLIQGRFVLRYRITRPFSYASAGHGIEALLERLGRRALTRQIAGRKIDASLTSDRREIAQAAAREVEAEAARLDLGIRISSIDVRELMPPAQVLAAFEDVTNARQFEKTLYENARQYHSSTTSRSRSEAAAILSRADGHAAGLIAAAQGESGAFNVLAAQYRRQPQLVASRILRETLDTVMSRIRSRTLLPASQASPSLILEPSPEFAR